MRSRFYCRAKRIALGLGALALLALVMGSVITPLPAELSRPPDGQSQRIESKDGKVLRELRGDRKCLSEWLPLARSPKLLGDAIVAAEDRRFYYHPGVDPFSVLRAAHQAITQGRFVSGASTLSMQLARQLRPHPRSLWGKLQEMALALRIEGTLSKSEILEQYLNRVDFGPNLRGVVAAARGYFDKPVAALSLGEIALLAGLPQSPTAYMPTRHRERAIRRRAYVLRQLEQAGQISALDAARAQAESVTLSQRRPAFGAPHFVTALTSGSLAVHPISLLDIPLERATRIRTTLDPKLQLLAETAISTLLLTLAEHSVTHAALLAVDNETGDVLAYVGSPNFFDSAHQGQTDGVRALRQPGSTLKPFVYAAAFEQLGYHAATVLPDLELSLDTESGPYRPRNFDDRFHGPVRLREALGNSLNIPAVHTAMRLGAPALLGYLHQLGFTSLEKPPEFYGPALALGDGEVTLLELVRAYSTLARGGNAIALRFVSEATVDGQLLRFAPASAERVMPAFVAATLTDILKDPRARLESFGSESPLSFDFDVAAKTGTSKGFRDNWVLGYTSRMTVGVWVGNFDGSPMRQVSGITGAGPIFHAFLVAAHAGQPPESLPLSPFQAPTLFALARKEICPLSGKLRGPHCPHGMNEYIPEALELPECDWHRELPIERQSGLLAGPDCPSGQTQLRPFEVFPDEYSAWAKANGRLLAPTQYSPQCSAAPTTDSSAPVALLTPTSGSRFVLDPERSREHQELKIEARAPSGTAKLTLLVNERPYAESAHPFEFFFRLQAGSFRFVVVTDQGDRSAPVAIEVREPQ